MQCARRSKRFPQLLPHPVPITEKHRGNQTRCLRVILQSQRRRLQHMRTQTRRHPSPPSDFRFSRPLQVFWPGSQNIIQPTGTKMPYSVKLSRIARFRR